MNKINHYLTVLLILLCLSISAFGAANKTKLLSRLDDRAVQLTFSGVFGGFYGLNQGSDIEVKYAGLMSLAENPTQLAPSLVVTRLHSAPGVLVRQEKYLLTELRYSDDGKKVEGLTFIRINQESQSGQSSILHLSKQRNHWISEDRVDRTLGQKKHGFSLQAKAAARVAVLFGQLQNRME